MSKARGNSLNRSTNRYKMLKNLTKNRSVCTSDGCIKNNLNPSFIREFIRDIQYNLRNKNIPKTLDVPKIQTHHMV